MTSNLVQRKIVWSCRSYQNLEQIHHHLDIHVFDGVICKPSKPWKVLANDHTASYQCNFIIHADKQ